MSEFQYYEFVAIDRPLSLSAQKKLRAITSRATITANRLVNTYEWGDFKGDPHALVTQYFDAFLYYANCGARQLMLRRHAGENRRTDRVPARPPNMKRITGSQMALAEFLRIDLSGS